MECQFEKIAFGSIRCIRCGTIRFSMQSPDRYHRVCTGIAAPTPVTNTKSQSQCCAKSNPVVTAAKAAAKWVGQGMPIAEDAEERLAICNSCDRLKNGRCQECSCIVALKVRLATEKCPIGKWGSDS
jgi:Family of unknown function (DUF6171)